MNSTDLIIKRYFPLLIGGIFLLISHHSFAGGSIPNLIGTWQGKATSHSKVHGFEILSGITFIIEDQKGRVFKGRKEWMVKGKKYVEGFSGLISVDNSKLYLAEHQGGTDIGEIITRDQIVLYYMKDGRNASTAFYELKRSK
jgi:hypothetical protein